MRALELDELKEKDSLAEFTGMWKGRDISVSEIRKKAWNNRRKFTMRSIENIFLSEYTTTHKISLLEI